MPCGDGCGTLDDLGATAQGQWIVEHAWEFGWITRYEDGFTPVTGYSPEPWHLRYIGPELARAYHDGGWHTLEDFFGLASRSGLPGVATRKRRFAASDKRGTQFHDPGCDATASRPRRRRVP